jgi:hypothetical protein
MRLLFFLFLFIGSLWAEAEIYSDTPDEVEQTVLYLSYDEFPTHLFRGQVFSIRLKTLSTISTSGNISYHFDNSSGVTLLTTEPIRKIEEPYYYDTFYFRVDSRNIRTPDITAVIKYSEFYEAYPTTIDGKQLEAVTLNPDRKYANIIADNFYITQVKTTRYDKNSNIAVFMASAEHCNLETFNLEDAIKQGFESLDNNYDTSTMTYYAIIPTTLKTLKFSYFNLGKKRFTDIVIPIVLDDDSVSTQSDLKPTEYKHTMLKIAGAGAVAFVGLLLLLFKRRFTYLMLIIIPGLYIAYVNAPVESTCVKKGSHIYLLPIKRGTIFETLSEQKIFEVQGSIKGYKKIKLDDNKIGWIKNEDICAY